MSSDSATTGIIQCFYHDHASTLTPPETSFFQTLAGNRSQDPSQLMNEVAQTILLTVPETPEEAAEWAPRNHVPLLMFTLAVIGTLVGVIAGIHSVPAMWILGTFSLIITPFVLNSGWSLYRFKKLNDLTELLKQLPMPPSLSRAPSWILDRTALPAPGHPAFTDLIDLRHKILSHSKSTT